MSIEVPRTEDLPTVILGRRERDPQPFQALHGRLLPGEDYSRHEFELLQSLVAAESLPVTPLPSLKQLSRIAIRNLTGCWELHAYKDTKNRARYGNLSIKGIEQGASNLAHRTMYMVFYGRESITSCSQFLDHLCENKTCCYPRHLELVTPGTNTQRGRISYVAGQLEIDYTG